MKLLSKLVASLLVFAIGLTVLAYVLSATLFNARYLESKASSTRLYSSLAEQIPSAVASGSGAEQQAIKQALGAMVTDKYVASKINPFVESLQAYYQSNAPAPQIDLSDLALQLQSQGITLAPDSSLTKPIVYRDPIGLKVVFDGVKLIKLAGPIMVLGLLGLLVLLSHGWHRITALVKVCLTAAVFEALVFGLFKLAPGMVESLTKSQVKGNPLAGLMLTFSKSLLASLATDFGEAAIGLVIAAAAILVIGLLLKTAGLLTHHGHGKETSVSFERPDSSNRPRMS